MGQQSTPGQLMSQRQFSMSQTGMNQNPQQLLMLQNRQPGQQQQLMLYQQMLQQQLLLQQQLVQQQYLQNLLTQIGQLPTATLQQIATGQNGVLSTLALQELSRRGQQGN
jgi:hypothetical protein